MAVHPTTVRDDERARVYDAATGEIVRELDDQRAADQDEPEFQMLDRYSGASSDALKKQVDWLGTISAGYKDPKTGYPVVSRDGTMYLSDPHGRSAKLAELLALSEWKRLTISVVSNDIRDIIHQHYVLYSRSSLLAHGDLFEMVEFVDSGKKDKDNQPILERRVHPVGTRDYDRVRAQCKATWSLFFACAAWDGPNVSVSFPDEFGKYRIRSGSRHSLANAVGKLREIAELTGGRLAGIPLILSLAYRDVAGPTGRRQNVPVFTFQLKPPDMIQLNSGNFRDIIGGALREAEKMRLLLPAPDRDAWEQGEVDDLQAPIEPPTDAEVARVQTVDAAVYDPAHYRAAFFATVKDSYLDNDTARAAFIAESSGTATTSLAEYLESASIADAEALILKAKERVLEWRRLRLAQDAETVQTAQSTEPSQASQPLQAPPATAGPVVDVQPGDPVPAAAPIDAPVIELPGPQATATASDPSPRGSGDDSTTAQVHDHPPTVADAVAPPPAPPTNPRPPRGNPSRPAAADGDASTHPNLQPSAERRDLEAEWGRTWRMAEAGGLKDHTVISTLDDPALRKSIQDLRRRIDEKERNEGSRELRDDAGDPANPALPF